MSLRSFLFSIVLVSMSMTRPAWAQDPTDPNDHRPAPPAKAAESQKKPPQPPPPPPARSASAAGQKEKAFRVAGFVELGNTSFTASQSFEAILDKSSLPIVGGGGQLALRNGLFVQVDISHSSDNGERAFVSNGQVFKLGIAEKVEMTPIDVTAGYRLHFGKRRRSLTLPPRAGAADRIVPYVGGGIGVVRYKETSDFAEPGDDVDESFTSYNALGGVEVAIVKWISVAGEFQQRWVPDGLGKAGVSKSYNETDLGGRTFRFKVIVGF